MSKHSVDTNTPLPLLVPRAADSHKGNFGSALLVGGSRGMSGAIALAGLGCLRSGAGLVKIGLPLGSQKIVATLEPSYMTEALPTDGSGFISVAARDRLRELSEWATCIAVGPGLGRTAELVELVGWMYEVFPLPMVFDADALYALSKRRGQLESPGGPRVLTPHIGEFSRFVGQNMEHEQAEVAAGQLASSAGVIIVLKGYQTLVTDGQRATHNVTGNPGMATGGSGDVLTGVITALVCQGLSPFDAARVGVYVHGLAGDLAAKEFGEVSMIASDIVRFLPKAFMQIESGRK